ncbi:MAG TPA: hypothetical protein VGK38_05530, partial [Prolixibacteraceae bacterium]
MRNFKFESIWLLSYNERKARREVFHPKRNLISGQNHTGKTTLIKSLFETLGASPQGKLGLWDKDVVSVVGFSVDDHQYRALNKRGLRALFDIDGKLLVATGDIRVWSDYFASITGFNLVLSNKESSDHFADPCCFFIPFYINQDGSWQSEWNT